MSHVEQAYEAYEAGNTEEARLACTAALAEAPHDADARFLMAVLAAEAGDEDSAIDMLRGALLESPHRGDALFYLASLLAQREDHLEAVEAYRAVIELGGKSWEVYSGLGSSLSVLGHYEEAIDWLEKAIAGQPASAELWALLGGTYLRWNRPAAALQGFLVAEGHAPDDPDLKCLVGTAYANGGDYTKAHAYFDKALELSPGHLTAQRRIRELGAVEAKVQAPTPASASQLG